MNRVKIADMKNNLSRHLAQVRAGGEITILDRETPVARLIPYAPRDAERGRGQARDDFWTPERLDELERQGVIQRGEPAASGKSAEIRPVKLPRGTPSLVDLLVQTRRESAR